MIHKFVEFLPDNLTEGIIYVSVEYGTIAHKCVCGCGNDVFTPLSPTDWKLTYDGESITLHPSIGNWNFDCKSHYWIKNNKIQWSDKWTKDEIKLGRLQDQQSKKDHYQSRETIEDDKSDEKGGKSKTIKDKLKFWSWLKKWFSI